MRLAELVEGLDSIGNDLTIYIESSMEWCEASEILLAHTTKSRKVKSGSRCFDYFLEVDLAKDAIEVWSAWNSRIPTISEKCAAILYYAENDAYLSNDGV